MRTILFITALFMSTLLSAQKPVEIPLWPNGAPNTNGLTGDQEDLNGGRVVSVHDIFALHPFCSCNNN